MLETLLHNITRLIRLLGLRDKIFFCGGGADTKQNLVEDLSSLSSSEKDKFGDPEPEKI